MPRSSRLSRHERILNSLFVLYPPPISFAISSFLFASCELLAPLMFTLNGKIIVPAARLLLVTCGDYYEGFFVNGRNSGIGNAKEKGNHVFVYVSPLEQHQSPFTVTTGSGVESFCAAWDIE